MNDLILYLKLQLKILICAPCLLVISVSLSVSSNHIVRLGQLLGLDFYYFNTQDDASISTKSTPAIDNSNKNEISSVGIGSTNTNLVTNGSASALASGNNENNPLVSEETYSIQEKAVNDRKFKFKSSSSSPKGGVINTILAK